MTNKERMQEQANGIILACSTFISDMAVDNEQVISVMSQAGITKEEWDNCEYEYSKENILNIMDGKLRWLDE